MPTHPGTKRTVSAEWERCTVTCFIPCDILFTLCESIISLLLTIERINTCTLAFLSSTTAITAVR